MSDITLETKLTDELATKRRKKGAFTLRLVLVLLTKWFFGLIPIKNYVLSWLFKTELQSLTFIDLTHPDDLERDTVHHKRITKSFFSNGKRYIHKSKE
jgi:hypothetical protein